jgi:hypothetical protein
MAEESPLLGTYLRFAAHQARVQEGRYFSWQNFKQQGKLTKL